MPMKVKKNVRDEIRRPDPIQSFFTDTIDWVRENRNRCIAIAIIAVIVGGAGWGYGYYRSARDEKAQFLLAQGIRSYQEYVGNPQGDALARTERTFQEAAKAGPAGVRDISRLYLARIALLKGSKEEARRLYSEVNRSASSDVVKKLSDAALQDLDKKPEGP